MFQIISDYFRGYLALGAMRSPRWNSVRKAYLREHPDCAVCGKIGKLIANECHHKIPFAVDHTLELDPKNLITLCRTHHYTFGHLESWKSFNKSVEVDSMVWKQKLANRP